MRFELGARVVQPTEIIQPGLFIALPQEMSKEQIAKLSDVSGMLGQVGLYGFDVNPDDDRAVLPYDPETQGSLGMVSYEAVMDYFSPPGLETVRDYLTVWHALRGSSARIARDEEKWQAYRPLAAEKERVQAAHNAAYQQWIDSFGHGHDIYKTMGDRVTSLSREKRQIESQIRKIKGGSQSLPHDQEIQPFIYVKPTEQDEARPLMPADNKSKATYVPDELTMLNLDNLHSNAYVRLFRALNISPDMRINKLLAQILNDRITARSQD
jgi:hypothetical protein